MGAVGPVATVRSVGPVTAVAAMLSQRPARVPDDGSLIAPLASPVDERTLLVLKHPAYVSRVGRQGFFGTALTRHEGESILRADSLLDVRGGRRREKRGNLPSMRIECPMCRKVIENAPADYPARPFCSPKCKLADLNHWFGEKYRIPGDPVDPDTLAQTPEKD